MTDVPDDTSLRHEIRWTVARLPPVPEMVGRVVKALGEMSESGAAQERKRIADILPEWAKALEEVR
jgi:hypothetical protein